MLSFVQFAGETVEAVGKRWYLYLLWHRGVDLLGGFREVNVDLRLL